MGNTTQQQTEPQQLRTPDVLPVAPAPVGAAPVGGSPVSGAAAADAATAHPSFTFSAVPERVSFPEEEKKTLAFWTSIAAFERGLEESRERKPFVFYDGPPFATGLPHYGHILAGTIKDVVCRYAHQTGHYVERRFGWDCHGLPIEYEIEKQRQIKTRQDVLDWGIANYNEACRSIVLRYTGEWRDVVTRFGRWIDFDKDYKTMDKDFMESVWWVFKQLFQKNLVYRAFKVMPYSTALATPLANFEVNQTAIDVSDPSVIVKFRLTAAAPAAAAAGASAEAAALLPLEALVWTTTPWTLPSNLALALNPGLTYVVVSVAAPGGGETTRYLLLKDRLDYVQTKLKWPKAGAAGAGTAGTAGAKVEAELPGSALMDLVYEPLFPYFKSTASTQAFRTIPATYVTATDGTGIVHQAPAFGEEDYTTCLAQGVISRDGSDMPCPLDANGRFLSSEVPEYGGQYIKEADKQIIKDLKSRGVMVLAESEVHSVKACPRSDTPLIYRAVPSWFIQVEGHNEQLVAHNEEIRWVPGHVKDGRFKNWLADAKDWCVSRNRFWGTPIPLWVSEDFSEVRCIGSVAELEELGVRKLDGRKLQAGELSDIHRHFIDDILVPSERNPALFLRRIDEVFDCWFESGSMPYGQAHYPFAPLTTGQAEADQAAAGGAAGGAAPEPASFIAEGLDQTRGWFYTLHVLSSHLFGRAAFKNVIVNGLVLAGDGKKMSKRLKNYPDPMEVCERHGADAVRLYMCNSPVVRAEPLRFKEDGVKEVVRDVFRPYYNAYRFLVQEVTRFEHFQPFPLLSAGAAASGAAASGAAELGEMDRWMLAASASLTEHVRRELDGYRLYSVAPRLVRFLEDLTNWYIKTNRDRMRVVSTSSAEEKRQATVALNVLYEVLLNVTILLAPFVPFVTELVYQNLRRLLPEEDARKQLSVHYVQIPEVDVSRLDADIERAIGRMQKVIETGRQMRDKKKVSLKTPVRQVKINAPADWLADLQTLTPYIQEELNAINVEFSADLKDVAVTLTPNWKLLGERLGPKMRQLPNALKTLTEEAKAEFEASGMLEVSLSGTEIVRLSSEEVLLVRSLSSTAAANAAANAEVAFVEAALVTIDFSWDAELEALAAVRELKSKVQKLRKACGVTLLDPVQAWVAVSAAEASGAAALVRTKQDELRRQLNGRALLPWETRGGHEVELGRETLELAVKGTTETVEVVLTVQAPQVHEEALLALVQGDAQTAETLKLWVRGFPATAVPTCARLAVNGRVWELLKGKHYN